MKIAGLPESVSDQVLKLILSFPEVQEIIVFGSRAKGNFREGSDIDLALKGPALTHEMIMLIKIAFDELELPWKLDLVGYNLLTHSDLKEHIDRVGISNLQKLER